MYVIGLDVGTSGVKSTVFGENAQIVSHARREYDLLCGAPGQYELDPEVLLQKSVEALRESVAAVNGKEVRAICITSFGESFVWYGQGRPCACKYDDLYGQAGHTGNP